MCFSVCRVGFIVDLISLSDNLVDSVRYILGTEKYNMNHVHRYLAIIMLHNMEGQMYGAIACKFPFSGHISQVTDWFHCNMLQFNMILHIHTVWQLERRQTLYCTYKIQV